MTSFWNCNLGLDPCSILMRMEIFSPLNHKWPDTQFKRKIRIKPEHFSFNHNKLKYFLFFSVLPVLLHTSSAAAQSNHLQQPTLSQVLQPKTEPSLLLRPQRAQSWTTTAPQRSRPTSATNSTDTIPLNRHRSHRLLPRVRRTRWRVLPTGSTGHISTRPILPHKQHPQQ